MSSGRRRTLLTIQERDPEVDFPVDGSRGHWRDVQDVIGYIDGKGGREETSGDQLIEINECVIELAWEPGIDAINSTMRVIEKRQGTYRAYYFRSVTNVDEKNRTILIRASKGDPTDLEDYEITAA